MRRYIAAVDLFCNAMALFLMCVILMRPLLNPPTEAAKAEPPGNLTVHIVWPVGNTDVDLWVHGPGEPRAIGYSRKSGKLWDLLRDDLGTVPDATGINFENAFTRGIVAGAYTVNVMCYRCPTVPIVVNVEVALSPDTGPLKVLVTTSVTLTKQGQELTAIRFFLEADGTIRPGSMHRVFKPLRSAKP